MTKQEKVLSHLKANKSITPLEALKKYGTFRLSALIFNLKKEGWNIDSKRTNVGSKKEPVYVAQYSLISKKKLF